MQDKKHLLFTITDRVFKTFITAYEGEGDDDSEPNNPGNTGTSDSSQSGSTQDRGNNPPGNPTSGSKDDKVLTQEQVNKIVQDRLAKKEDQFRAQQSELITKIEELEKTATLTDDERNTLKKRIEELRSENLSSEERANREIKQLQLYKGKSEGMD